MFIEVDPLNPMDLPIIKFAGSEDEVKLKEDLVSKNLHVNYICKNLYLSYN